MAREWYAGHKRELLIGGIASLALTLSACSRKPKNPGQAEEPAETERIIALYGGPKDTMYLARSEEIAEKVRKITDARSCYKDEHDVLAAADKNKDKRVSETELLDLAISLLEPDKGE